MDSSPDFIERRTAALLAAARRSGFFREAIDEAKYLAAEYGYCWDVALAISCRYWCS